MQAVIMAGGFGTRLKPLTNNAPKPMIHVANKPMMEHVVNLLKIHGIVDLIVLLYVQPEVIKNYFKDGAGFGVNIEYVLAEEDYGTAGAVKNVEKIIKDGNDDDFLVISADIITDVNLKKPIDFHIGKKSDATIVLTRVENPLPYGIVITDSEGRVTKFLEKPTWSEVFSDTVNTGIYILRKNVLKLIPEKSEFDFSKDLFPLLLKENKNLFGHICSCYWRDVGTLSEYRQSHLDIIAGKIDLNVEGETLAKNNIKIGEKSIIDISCDVENSIFGKDVHVLQNCKIKNCVVGDNCIIGENTALSGSVVGKNSKIGANCEIQEAIIGYKSNIGRNVFIGSGAVISDVCNIGNEAVINPNVKIWPFKNVEDGAILSESLIWSDKWSAKIFGQYGITALANLEITPEFASKLGAAFGATIGKNRTISVSRDSHKTSRLFSRAMMSGVLSVGVNVNDFSDTPISIVRYQAKQFKSYGGIHVRKHPFDKKLLNIKFFDHNGLDLSPLGEQKIERLFFREDYARVGSEETGEIFYPTHGTEYYTDGFLSKIDTDKIIKKKFKIVIDYSYGSSSKIFPAIIGRLGIDSVHLNANLDQTKITKTEREFKKSLKDLSSIVKSISADIGIFIDNGGEKIYICDENGDNIDGNTALSLMCLLVMKTEKMDKIISVPVNSSCNILKMAKDYNFEVILAKNSSNALMEKSADSNVYFAGDNEGGYIYSKFMPAFDGMYSAVKLLEMLARLNTTIKNEMRYIEPTYFEYKIIPCPTELKGFIMRKLIEKYRDENALFIDGIKLIKPNGWVLAYPASEGAHFEIFSESREKDEALALINQFSGDIDRWKNERNFSALS
ncbi:MAG: nucleotidyltransferase [Candidatus Acidulodesulfobacterium ferriphilum]|uniref:Nucleotidyltransferase n=1 Tax=Candidatus Acidulodesulfobacterium ferriphilum TaxID=2597223 RepID=A0A519BE11_9DELT|nr:MAG: nucleotidyltransferase [Candidatus Acidulodesulfobacterium ferriphilum]